MARDSHIPKTINLTLASLIMLATLFQLLVLPLWLSSSPWTMAAIILALAPLNTPFWSLIHEGIHRNMHPGRAANEAWSRALSVVFGAAFHVLRFGHLMHHQYNRNWESEIYEPPQKKWIVAINHYFKMLCGIYLVEIFLSYLVALTPKNITLKIADRIFDDEHHRHAVRQMLQKPGNVARLRIDCALIALLYGVAFYLYGSLWPLLVLLIGIRAFVISIMDNAYHYDTPPDNSVAAKELYLPPLMARMILNFNYHLTHHKNTGLPWSALAKDHEDKDRIFDGGLVTALLAQFKGPLAATRFDKKRNPA